MKPSPRPSPSGTPQREKELEWRRRIPEVHRLARPHSGAARKSVARLQQSWHDQRMEIGGPRTSRMMMARRRSGPRRSAAVENGPGGAGGGVGV